MGRQTGGGKERTKGEPHAEQSTEHITFSVLVGHVGAVESLSR